MLVFDLRTTIINFALYQAVSIAELGAGEKWKDFHRISTIAGIQASVLNLVSGVGYFTAYMFAPQIVTGELRRVSHFSEYSYRDSCFAGAKVVD
jgi:hypothetical protein